MRRRRQRWRTPRPRELLWGLVAVASVASIAIHPIFALGLFVPILISGLGLVMVRRGWRAGDPALARLGERLAALVSPDVASTISLESGLIACAPEEIDRLLRQLTSADGALAWNAAINGEIWRGRYHDAVRLYLAHARDLRNEDAWLAALVRVNVAEALYNLGRWSTARRLVDVVLADSSWRRGERTWVADGAEAQRAWIAAHQCDVDRGRELVRGFNAAGFPPDYRTELSFTAAVVELSAGDAASAEAHLNEARKVVVRASSRRNLLFLEARAAAARGDVDEAIAKCREASEQPYRGQGGDGLLFWGDLHAQRGELDAARRAWALAVERDPQSESARAAQARLASHPTRDSDSGSVPTSTEPTNAPPAETPP